MSNFPSYMALGASAATYARVADIEYAVTQLTDALINELAAIGETLTDSLAVQQELLNREVFQSNIEEFIYQLEKSVQEVEDSKSGESPVTHFFRLSYFLNTVDQEQINTNMIKGRENKAAFDRAVSRASELSTSLRTNGEVIAAIVKIERDEARKNEEARRSEEDERRRRVLREEKLKRRWRGIIILIVAITSFLLIYPIYLLLESPRMRAYRGSSNAQKALAQKYYDVQDYTQAFKWFQRAADQGDMDAQYQLGRLYYRGEGVSKDYREAVNWFQKDAGRGNIEAQRLKDSLSQFMDMQKKAEQGVANAQFELSQMYYSGEFVSKNNTEAFKWLQKAAERGYLAAQHQLGLMYYKGDNISRDYSEALRWFQKAASQGDPESQYYLGYMYFLGYGISSDRREGAKWLCKASAQDFWPAQEDLKTWGIKCGR